MSWPEERPFTHMAFRRKLIESLSEPICSSASTRSESNTPPRAPSACTSLPSERKRRDCVVCSDRENGPRHLTHCRCATCSDNPVLSRYLLQSLPHTKELSHITYLAALPTNHRSPHPSKHLWLPTYSYLFCFTPPIKTLEYLAIATLFYFTYRLCLNSCPVPELPSWEAFCWFTPAFGH